MNLNELLRNSFALLPELVLAVTICIVLFADMIVPLKESKRVCGTIAIVGVLVALCIIASSFPTEQKLIFAGTVVIDRLTALFRLVFATGAFVTVAFSLRSNEFHAKRFGELISLLLGAVVGACFMASANNFVIFLLGMETLSMCSYVLSAFLKQNRSSAESGLKYVLFGAIATGVMLFGISYLYGLSGSLSISIVMQKLAPTLLSLQVQELIVVLALLLLLVGVGFKIAMVPFHFWCPDVYEGAPTTVTAFLSVVSKAAGFGALLRILSPILISPAFEKAFQNGVGLGVIQVSMGIIAVITMTLGNLTAIRQSNVKRMLAYSSIAHAGYLIMGLSVLTPASVEAMLMYIVIYLFMNLGAFWVVIALENNVGSSEIQAFKGAGFKSPLLFVALFICLISLTGLPPTAGFVAKFRLFGVVISAGIDSMSHSGAITNTAYFYFTIALIGVLNSVVSLFYYMRIASTMVFKEPEKDMCIELKFLDKVFALALSIPLLIFLNFGPLLSLVKGTIHIPQKPVHTYTSVERTI